MDDFPEPATPHEAFDAIVHAAGIRPPDAADGDDDGVVGVWGYPPKIALAVHADEDGWHVSLSWTSDGLENSTAEIVCAETAAIGAIVAGLWQFLGVPSEVPTNRRKRALLAREATAFLAWVRGEDGDTHGQGDASEEYPEGAEAGRGGVCALATVEASSPEEVMEVLDRIVPGALGEGASLPDDVAEAVRRVLEDSGIHDQPDSVAVDSDRNVQLAWTSLMRRVTVVIGPEPSIACQVVEGDRMEVVREPWNGMVPERIRAMLAGVTVIHPSEVRH